MKKILMDIDGVLADFWAGFSAIFHSLDPAIAKTTGTQRECYSYTEDEKKVLSAAWDTVMSSAAFWRNVDSLCHPAVFDRLNKMRRRHEIYYVTARVGLRPQQDTQAWLIKRGVSEPTVLVPRPVWNNDIPSVDKASIARLLGVEYSLEDSPKMASELNEAIKHSYLINRPYNAETKGLKRVERVEQFLDIVEGT